jgi:hypothetical protein
MSWSSGNHGIASSNLASPTSRWRIVTSPTHPFRRAGVPVAAQMRDVLDRDPALESSETKLCHSSRGIHSSAWSPACSATWRNARRALAASKGCNELTSESTS